MKKIFISFLFLFIILHNTNAQWTQINTGSNDNYTHISFINDSAGILSSNQVLMLTKNYGNSWDTIYFNSNEYISDVHFLSDSTIYFIGSLMSNNSFLNKTFDLGNNWTAINAPTVGKMFFTSPDTGHVLIANEVIRTFDGGSTWTLNSSIINSIAGNIYFPSPTIGYRTGWYDNVIYKTTDAGVSWQLMTGGDHGGLDLHFPSLDTGYVCGWNGTISKTSDAGINWTSLISDVSINLVLNSIYCTSNNVCYSVGDSGTIIKTINGGNNWIKENSGIQKKLNSIFCTNFYCYAVGDSGVVLRTTNIVGIKEKEVKKKEIKIYPNPANQVINIELKSNQQICNINISDIRGKNLYEGKSTTIDISRYSKGIYFVNVKTEKETYTEKIIIE
ncbi:MAG: T9SS type A sorting domain-containing protein [Bacteroidetes bacterium]|nr:T9SS type A sorting domain-containing protein [Bacteroidota bacterium]MDQ3190213.1 T9SS type A sorting domain-containing protein [Bacteroidota bacterium]